MERKSGIKELTIDELRGMLVQEGFPAFRARQIYDWIYLKNVDSFQKMMNVPVKIITLLESVFILDQMKPVTRQVSRDGSEKFLFKLKDNHLIESVMIRGNKRNTLCLSSQVGCLWHCLFCASGKDGFQRNLTAGEMVDQILLIQRITDQRIHNIVFMGMGEPFNNYEQVMKSVNMINCRQGINIGARRITISTCGIIPEIIKLTHHPLQVELSVSLHSADENVRSALMPVNDQYPLKELIVACRYYVQRKKRQITFEYLMLKGINDSVEQAQQLCRLIADFDSKVNLIVYNPIRNQNNLLSSDEKAISVFQQIIRQNQIPVTIRYSRGQDIHAACGQLKGHYLHHDE